MTKYTIHYTNGEVDNIVGLNHTVSGNTLFIKNKMTRPAYIIPLVNVIRIDWV